MKLSRTTFQQLVDGEIDWIPVRTPAGKDNQAREIQCLLPGSFNPFHDGHLTMARQTFLATKKPVWFELSICNVDKATLDFEEVEMRLRQEFGGTQFGIVLSKSATFEEKLKLFPEVAFVVGADTILRINDLRFYENESHQRIVFQAFQNKNENLPRFRVFGRWCDTKFLEDEIEIEATLRQTCTFIPQHEFDMRISSTELRNQAEKS